MDIIHLPYEAPLKLTIGKDKVEVFCFKTDEEGNVKFGVNAPRSVSVNREEIYHAKKSQLAEAQ